MKDSHAKAKKYALKLISYKSRSEKELKDRLKRKGISESVICSTLEYLKEVGLVNDFYLAQVLKEEALTRRLLSQNGAKKFVLNRGIPKDIVDIIFNIDEQVDTDNARKIVDKKLKILKSQPPHVINRRLYNFLLRKGYSYETIMKILKERNFFKEDQDEKMV